MEPDYNSSMYLTPADLNAVEDKIEELTIRIQDNLYEERRSPLRNIQVGDNLSGKILYLSFPRNLHTQITSTTEEDIIKVDSYNKITNIYSDTYNTKSVFIVFNRSYREMYAKATDLDASDNPYANMVRYEVPNNFGVVTEIDSTNPIYQYIKIYDDDTIIPDYVKKTWVANEIPFMQDIDNIEQGVANLGKYFTRPLGWITEREWFDNGKFYYEQTDFNVGIKGFSYIDINRWITDINLIDNEEIVVDGTYWNMDKSEYHWEGHTNWIDYDVQYDGHNIEHDGSKIQYKYLD